MKIIRKEKEKMKLRSAKYVKFNLQVLINTAINYNLRGCVTLTVCSPIITKYSFWDMDQQRFDNCRKTIIGENTVKVTHPIDAST